MNFFVLFPYRHVINCKYPQRQESNAMKKEMTEVTINDTNQLYIPQIKVPQCKSIIMDLHLVITTKMFAARVNCNSVANCSLELFIIDPHKHAYAAKCLLDRYTY